MYIETFGALVFLCAALSFVFREEKSDALTPRTVEFKSFQYVYLFVYLMLMTGDWLQGPYVYALYQQYGYGTDDIAILFIAGFLSSAIFGTVIGSFADTIGRKKSTILFCFIYSLSCVTKLSSNFSVLFVGRILAGIATSLLFSVPEAWMVCQHNLNGFDSNLLSDTFSWGTWGNGLVAILSGVIANWAADLYGPASPFMVAIVTFFLATIVVWFKWPENYGQTKSVNWLTSLVEGFKAARSDIKILSIGAIQSLFEGAMYSFVFLWTPALQRGLSPEKSLDLPFGWIFACFMVSVMVGSIVFGWLAKKYPVEILAKPVYFVGSILLIIPAISTNEQAIFFSFIGFEFICGIHWPLSGTLRGIYVPEESRSAVMNLMRLPLNLIVVIVLIKVSSMDVSTVFLICATLISFCFIATFSLPVSSSQGKPILGH